MERVKVFCVGGEEDDMAESRMEGRGRGWVVHHQVPRPLHQRTLPKYMIPMCLYSKFVAVHQEGGIPQLLAQHSFFSKALVGERLPRQF
jgi:hypothetical protein